MCACVYVWGEGCQLTIELKSSAWTYVPDRWIPERLIAPLEEAVVKQRGQEEHLSTEHIRYDHEYHEDLSICNVSLYVLLLLSYPVIQTTHNPGWEQQHLNTADTHTQEAHRCRETGKNWREQNKRVTIK